MNFTTAWQAQVMARTRDESSLRTGRPVRKSLKTGSSCHHYHRHTGARWRSSNLHHLVRSSTPLWDGKKGNKVQNLQMLNYINSVLDVFEIEFECECTSFPHSAIQPAEKEWGILCEFNSRLCRPSTIERRNVHTNFARLLQIVCRCSICQVGRTPTLNDLRTASNRLGLTVGKLLLFVCEPCSLCCEL